MAAFSVKGSSNFGGGCGNATIINVISLVSDILTRTNYIRYILSKL